MELVIGFVIAMALVLLGSEEGWLGEDNERAWINHLADESRKRKPQGARRRCRYVQAGCRIKRRTYDKDVL